MIGRWAFGLAAAFSFALTTYLLVARSDAAGAGVAAGVFLVAALLAYLPEIEFLKAFGIEARLRARLSEANEILVKLRRLAIVNGKMAYQQLGWGNRMGSASMIDKQKLADEVDSVLRALGGTSEELSEMKEDYLRLAVFDLSQIFNRIVDLRVEFYRRQVRELHAALSDNESERRAAFDKEIQEFNKIREAPMWTFDRKVDVKSIDEYCKSRLNLSLHLANDPGLRKLAEKIVNVVNVIARDKRVSDEAASLIELHSDEARKKYYESIFSEELKD